MHSWPIMVESMSATNSRLRRPAAVCTTTSTGRPASASRTRSAMALVVRAAGVKENVGGDARVEPCGVAAAPRHAGARARARHRRARARRVEIRSRHEVMRDDRTRAVLIAGPTASGKSALALALARAARRHVINADSMQVYRDLRVITARPSAGRGGGVPHRLYGHVDAAENYSVGRWLADAARRARRGASAAARADLRRRHRALFQGADARACRRPADPGRDSRGRARAAGGRRAAGTACRTGAPRSRDGGALQAQRPHAHRARAGGAGGDWAAAERLAPRGTAAALDAVERQ